MRTRRLRLALLALGLAPLAGPPVAALAEPAGVLASPPDPRIRTVFYDPDRVVRIDAFYGYQLMVQFAADERIQNVAIGEGAAWQVTPNKAANLLFIKPSDPAPATNMTVVTDRRSYLFELRAHGSGSERALGPIFVLRFAYPPPPAVVVAETPPPKPPERRNTAYSYKGSRELLPSLVFDDGRFTYFQWPAETAAPAVFAVAEDGSESLVNSSWRDGFEAVEQIAPSFRLREGKTVTTVINEGWRPPDRGSEAPRPHDRKTAREAEREGARP